MGESVPLAKTTPNTVFSYKSPYAAATVWYVLCRLKKSRATDRNRYIRISMQYSVPRLIVNVQAWRNVRNADGTFNLSARANAGACAEARRPARARSLNWNFWKSPVRILARSNRAVYCEGPSFLSIHLNAAILTNLDPWLVWLSWRQKLRLPGGEGACYLVSVELDGEKRRDRRKGGQKIRDSEGVVRASMKGQGKGSGMGRNSNSVAFDSFSFHSTVWPFEFLRKSERRKNSDEIEIGESLLELFESAWFVNIALHSGGWQRERRGRNGMN